MIPPPTMISDFKNGYIFSGLIDTLYIEKKDKEYRVIYFYGHNLQNLFYLKNLNEKLLENPKIGIELSSGLFKMRLENSSSNIGKSGGFRVIYYYIDEEENLYLLKIYSKTEIENIKEEVLVKILKSQLD